MRAIITAAGSGSRWANYTGRRKHQIRFDGETLLDRTVRMLNARGITDIYVTHHPYYPYQVQGQITAMKEAPMEASNAVARLFTQPFWHTTDKTLVLLGDVYFTDAALDIMVKPYDGWTHFARLKASQATGKPGPEMFGCQFSPEDHYKYAEALHRAGPGSDWPAYCAITNHPVDTDPQDIRDWGMHVEIPDDGTDDFDYADDYERFMQAMLGRSARRVVRSDYDQPWFAARTAELGAARKIHRKLWEHCAIAQVYKDRIHEGGKLLGFGVGREALPAWFAAQGATVVATDRPDAGVWLTRQHAAGLRDLRFEGVCPSDIFSQRVFYSAVDMTQIPAYLAGIYDMTWSSSCFEHVGGITAGLDFFCAQMRCLKPGGIAVHTTEYQTGGKGTIEGKDLCVFRASDFQALAARLEAQGDRLWPIALGPGAHADDRHVDTEPFSLEPHLQLQLGSVTFTSVLLIAMRGRHA